MIPTLSLDQIAHVIALATAPAFLIGGVVNFVSLLVGRMASVMDRARVLHEIDASDQQRSHLKSDMPRLRRRARLIHASMIAAIFSGVMTALVMVIAFVGALTSFDVETAVAVLFVSSLLLFTVALSLLVHEALIALGEFRHYV